MNGWDMSQGSSYGYPPKYKGAKPIAEQVECLRECLPELSSGSVDTFLEEETLRSPQWIEGQFAILDWEVIGRTYTEALKKVLGALTSKFRFFNQRAGKLGPAHLRQHEETIRMFRKLKEKQGGSIFVVSAQFGLQHLDRSVINARENSSILGVGLGSFAVGCMLLAHPERMQPSEGLSIPVIGADCPGDEYAPDGDGEFSEAPYFSLSLNGDRIEFGTCPADAPNPNYGSVTAVLR